MDRGFFTLVVAIITAYCIYQQNKHYLKVKLAFDIIDNSKDIIKQCMPSQTFTMTTLEEEIKKWALVIHDADFIHERL